MRRRIKQAPEYNKIRIRYKFCLLPREVGGEIVWLEKLRVVEKFYNIKQTCEGCDSGGYAKWSFIRYDFYTIGDKLAKRNIFTIF